MIIFSLKYLFLKSFGLVFQKQLQSKASLNGIALRYRLRELMCSMITFALQANEAYSHRQTVITVSVLL